MYRFGGLSFREFLELKTGEQFESFSLEDIVENYTEIAFELTSKFKPF